MNLSKFTQNITKNGKNNKNHHELFQNSLNILQNRYSVNFLC